MRCGIDLKSASECAAGTTKGLGDKHGWVIHLIEFPRIFELKAIANAFPSVGLKKIVGFPW
jgi:hypothetical protein